MDRRIQGQGSSVEKHLRRQTANSNERRRMENINAGYSLLESLLPPASKSEKLSKAAVLKLTADNVNKLKMENERLRSQNADLERVRFRNFPDDAHPPPEKKPKIILYGNDDKEYVEDDDEETRSSPEERSRSPGTEIADQLSKEIVSLRHQLEIERRRRFQLEELQKLKGPAPGLDIPGLTPAQKSINFVPRAAAIKTEFCEEAGVPEANDRSIAARNENNNLFAILEAIKQVEGEEQRVAETQNEGGTPTGYQYEVEVGEYPAPDEDESIIP